MTLEEICNPDSEQRRIDALKRFAKQAQDRVKDAKARAKWHRDLCQIVANPVNRALPGIPKNKLTA